MLASEPKRAWLPGDQRQPRQLPPDDRRAREGVVQPKERGSQVRVIGCKEGGREALVVVAVFGAFPDARWLVEPWPVQGTFFLFNLAAV